MRKKEEGTRVRVREGERERERVEEVAREKELIQILKG